MHPVATSRVVRALVLGKISEAEKIEVGEPDITIEIEAMLENAESPENIEENREILNAPENRKSIKNQLIARKAVQRLIEIASAENESVETKPAKAKTAKAHTAETETGKTETAKIETVKTATVKKPAKKKEEKK